MAFDEERAVPEDTVGAHYWGVGRIICKKNGKVKEMEIERDQVAAPIRYSKGK